MRGLEFSHVTKRYSLGSSHVLALDEVNHHFQPGVTLLRGPSGSGKSTLLHLAGALDDPTQGQVLFHGHSLSSLSEKEKTQWRRTQVGFVFQDFHLLGQLNLMDNIAYPLHQRGRSAKDCRTRVTELLKQVGLMGYERRFPRELSGGERQRVAIARSLVACPKLLIADEPTANLDSKTGQSILDLLLTLLEQHSEMLLLVASHDQLVMDALGAQQVQLQDGRLLS